MIAAHVWQSTLFALVAGLLTLALRRNGAHIRYWVWLAASIKFLIPFAVLTAAADALGLRAPLTIPGTLVIAAQSMAAPVPAATDLAAAVFAALWTCGAAVVLGVRAAQLARIAAAVRGAAPLAIAAPLPVRTASWPMEPGIAGLLRPVLLLPDGIAGALGPAELRAVLAHEICHWRRRDNLTAALHMLTEAVFWFHPLVWWIGAKLVEERERACDEHVLAAGGDAETYAEGILKVCKLYTAAPLACTPGVSGGSLKQRIEDIMTRGGAAPLSPTKRLMLILAACVVIVGPPAAVWLGFTDVMRAPAGRCDDTGRICSPRQDPARPNIGAGEMYPPESRRLGEEGRVVLLLTVDDTGRVTAAKVQTGSGYTRLDEAARGAAFSSWRFLPGTVDGVPRAMRMPIRVTFRNDPNEHR